MQTVNSYVLTDAEANTIQTEYHSKINTHYRSSISYITKILYITILWRRIRWKGRFWILTPNSVRRPIPYICYMKCAQNNIPRDVGVNKWLTYASTYDLLRSKSVQQNDLLHSVYDVSDEMRLRPAWLILNGTSVLIYESWRYKIQE